MEQKGGGVMSDTDRKNDRKIAKQIIAAFWLASLLLAFLGGCAADLGLLWAAFPLLVACVIFAIGGCYAVKISLDDGVL